MPPRCRKNKFATKQAAEEVLLRLLRSGNPGKKPRRAYQCDVCQHWHLTSRPS